MPPGDFDVNRLKGMLDDIGVPLGGPAQAKLRDLERQQAAGPSSLRGLMDTYGPMLGELKGSAMLQPLMGLMMSNPSGTLPQGIAASLAEVGGAVERQRKEAAMERERQEEEKRTIQTEETAQVQVTETMIETCAVMFVHLFLMRVRQDCEARCARGNECARREDTEQPPFTASRRRCVCPTAAAAGKLWRHRRPRLTKGIKH